MTAVKATTRARQRPRPRRLPTYVVLTGVAWLLLLVLLTVADGAPWGRHLSDLSFVAFPTLAGVSCLARSRSTSGGEKRLWALLGVAMWVWAAGGGVWAYSGFTRAGDYPFPSWADVGFLGYVVPTVAGLLCAPGVTRSLVGSLRVGLDGLVLAAALLFVTTATVLTDIFGSPLSAGDRVVLLAYPLGDLVVVSLTLAVAMRVTRESRRTWGALGGGLVCLATVDSLYVHFQSSGQYQPGTVLDIGWASAFLVIGIAPHVGDLGRLSTHRLTAFQRLIPSAVVLLAVLTGVNRASTVVGTPLLVVLAMLLLILVGLRHFFAVVDETRVSTDLDNQVAARTNDLRAEREFLRAVVDNLDAGVVACDAESRITFFNDATALMHADVDLTRVEDWKSDLCGPDGTTPLPYEEVPLFQALRGETVREAEFTVVPPGASPVRLSATGRALYDEAGKTVGAVVAMHDVTELRRSYQVLADRDVQDELTGLGNRRKYAEVMASVLTEQRVTAVLLIDLDDFKDINDSLGHDAGDRFLVETGRRILGAAPPDATVCRLGGDEYAIVLPDSSQTAAIRLAERLIIDVAQRTELAGADLETTASIGIALSASEAASAGQMLKAADLAMYRAKTGGKGRYVLFDQTLQHNASQRLSLQSDLRRAVLAEELTLVYQPVVELSGGAMIEVETLVRWTHPGRGGVSPAEFIPIAEETGLIVTLGNWVLRTACAQLLAWDAAGGDARLGLAVNVSTKQLERFGLLSTLDDCLARGLDPTRLTLEVTETAFTVDNETADATMQAVRDRGVNLAIDDFGTGYSSLARLRSSPVGRLKIDRSFIDEIQYADSHVPIVEATLTMAQGLGFGLVAEGVETPAQLSYLRNSGCPAVQGFLLSRPLPPSGILALMSGPRPWDHQFTAPRLLAPPRDNEFDRLLALADDANVDLDHLVRPLLAELRTSTGLDIAYLTRVDLDAGEQHIEYVHNRSPARLTGGALDRPTEGLVISWADSLCKRALDRGPRRTRDAQATYRDADVARKVGLRSYLVEPVLKPDGTLYGTLCGGSPNSLALSQTDSATVSMFARLIGNKLQQVSRATETGEDRSKRPDDLRTATCARGVEKVGLIAGEDRNRAADRRDERADDRDRAADRRDDNGDDRDLSADDRDHTADERDNAAARRDALSGLRDENSTGVT
ncbi:MAG: EAL domain-containing protein [Nocardioides sp.]